MLLCQPATDLPSPESAAAATPGVCQIVVYGMEDSHVSRPVSLVRIIRRTYRGDAGAICTRNIGLLTTNGKSPHLGGSVYPQLMCWCRRRDCSRGTASLASNGALRAFCRRTVRTSRRQTTRQAGGRWFEPSRACHISGRKPYHCS